MDFIFALFRAVSVYVAQSASPEGGDLDAA